MSPVKYSIGRDRYDAYPKNFGAQSFDEFESHVLSLHSPTKANARYVAASFDDGRRCATSAAPCAWVALDADGIEPDILPEWRLWLCRHRGFGWPTHSSTPAAPRERAIIALSEAVDRTTRVGIARLLMQDLGDEFGTHVQLDPCAARPEQPMFLRPSDATPFRLLGEPIDVALWRAQIAPPPPPPPPATADAADIADARMRWLVRAMGEAGLLRKPLENHRGFAVVCPWQGQHTTADASGSTASALLYPAPENGWQGAYRCLHAHCDNRRLRDLLVVLRAAAVADARGVA